ncbi:MFS transporter [Pseudosulfitobacter pseudonitzschiae]|uniref:MFS transporter n=1 Tax=Pseudosulfitobacter pseudonitzschiae TaxID=1402135 RepID=UPI001AF3D538|nr:MFS transporter [Pseudosulfitobacter pseudonitzschiae]MBM1813694.1 MFS transporter [Pseudosulfitobacter pseudonitzschiae]MBM1830687.1 MFS transporter [Pseudosulfitobacter pseudonitzschiae]MBM1835554.1 MFS transporter [Pseudosulfitobacter pseudonitzschiae]MBM1840400.1 MFS transporter [Pseudosulfitobacter pseudonitzschiae]MBM1845612.1 MFS transporter [Pseudosulfitobacter pseudonitzschiae]
MDLQRRLYGALTEDDAQADAGQVRAFATHFTALTATKLAGGLVDPKLVLSSLLVALGAPGGVIGALVPVREAGALLPQLALAAWIERSRQRKWFWAAGAVGQGIAALGMVAAALTLDGVAAGWAILGCLALLAVCRSAGSASYKDVLARTLDKGTRGTVSGLAGTIGAVGVLIFAIMLSVGIIPGTPAAIAMVIAVAGGLLIAAGLIFTWLQEPEAEVGDASQGLGGLRAVFAPLRKDAQLRRYIMTRTLLISTALAPPFVVMLSAGQGDSINLGHLGLLVLASSAAAIVSSYIWGRLSDRSSRQTLMFAGIAAAAVLALAAVVGMLTGDLGGAYGAAGFVFAAKIAYEGARAGRKTHLADMDAHGQKAIYTALSNSILGVMLLLGGLFGLMADIAGPALVLGVFAAMAAGGALVAVGLDEVQADTT